MNQTVQNTRHKVTL